MRLIITYLRLLFSIEKIDAPLSLHWDAKLNALLDGVEAGRVTTDWLYGYLVLSHNTTNYHVWIGDESIRKYAIGKYSGRSLVGIKYRGDIIDSRAANMELRVMRSTKARLLILVEDLLAKQKAINLKKANKSFS